jgi:hypothetical protein
MKKFIALCAIVSASSAFATSELEFGDLNYFIKQKQVNLFAMARYQDARYKLKATSGSTVAHEKEGYKAMTYLGYGIMDNLNVFVGLNYDFQNEFTNTTTNDIHYNQDGLNNPLFGGNYRIINQKDAAVNFDVGVLARQNIQQAKSGASIGAGKSGQSKDGNAADGRSSYELNSSIGRKWNEANEWRLTGGYVRNTDGDRDQLSTTTSTQNIKMNSSNDMYLLAMYQYRPVQEFMMSLSGKAIRIEEYSEKLSGVKTKDDAHMRYDFLFNAKYLVTETLILDWRFAQSRIPDFDTKTGSTKSKYRAQVDGYMSLGLNLLF